MKFTIGYIAHDEAVYDRHLGPSLLNLKGEFDVIHTSDVKFPSSNYNEMKRASKTEYTILTHQDVSFQPDLLERIEDTIDKVENLGALGLVGKYANTEKWSNSQQIFEVDTLDCCFIVIKTSDPIWFNEDEFGEYHLYVEDYCAQLNRALCRTNYTMLTDGMQHHSATWSVRGSCWGNYRTFKQKLVAKWPGIQTT